MGQEGEGGEVKKMPKRKPKKRSSSFLDNPDWNDTLQFVKRKGIGKVRA